MGKEMIVKDNNLIEAHYNLTTVQQKVLLKAISIIEPNKEQYLYRFSIADFAEKTNLKGSKTLYSQIAEICDQLTDSKRLSIKRKDGGISFINWVASAEYIPKEAVIEIEFSQKLMPFLVELKEHFTTYNLENVMELKSNYSIRIYEILKQYEKIKKRRLNLQTLRELVGTTEVDQNGTVLKEDYSLYGHFKSRVILSAQKELKEKTDIYFEFEEIKSGRKVIAIEFYIFENAKNKKQSNFDVDKEDIKILKEKFYKKTKQEITDKVLIELVKAKGVKKVKKYIDNIENFNQESIKNLIGFFKKAVLNEYEIPSKKRISNYTQREYNNKDLEKLYANNELN